MSKENTTQPEQTNPVVQTIPGKIAKAGTELAGEKVASTIGSKAAEVALNVAGKVLPIARHPVTQVIGQVVAGKYAETKAEPYVQKAGDVTGQLGDRASQWVKAKLLSPTAQSNADALDTDLTKRLTAEDAQNYAKALLAKAAESNAPNKTFLTSSIMNIADKAGKESPADLVAALNKVQTQMDVSRTATLTPSIGAPTKKTVTTFDSAVKSNEPEAKDPVVDPTHINYSSE